VAKRGGGIDTQGEGGDEAVIKKRCLVKKNPKLAYAMVRNDKKQNNNRPPHCY